MNELTEGSGLTRRTAIGGLSALVALGVIAATPVTAAAATTWWYPHTTRWLVRSPFGYRVHPVTGHRSFHDGVDLGSDHNTPIFAMRSGTVKIAGVSGGFGNYVLLEHADGYETGYGHQNSIVVKVGQSVSAGTLLGYVGSTGVSTGDHLHVLMHLNGQAVDPGPILAAAPLSTGTAQPIDDETPAQPLPKESTMIVLANQDTNQWVAADHGRWDAIPSGQGDLYVALAGRDRVALSDRDFQLARSYFLGGKQTDTKVYANTATNAWYVIGPGVFYAIPSGQGGIFENAFGPRLAVDNSTFQALQAAFQR